MTRDEILKLASKYHLEPDVEFEGGVVFYTDIKDVEAFYLDAYRAGQAEMRERAFNIAYDIAADEGLLRLYRFHELRALPLEGE